MVTKIKNIKLFKDFVNESMLMEILELKMIGHTTTKITNIYKNYGE